MPKPISTLPAVRMNVYLQPENAALIQLARADQAFGGTRYGALSHIINIALKEYFDNRRKPDVSTGNSSQD